MRFNLKRYFQVLGVCVLVIVLGVLAVFGYNYVGGLSLGDNEVPESITKTSGGKINVLLMGVDIEGYHTDAMMLVSFDTTTKDVKMLSIPRDTRMYIGSRYQKINAAYAIGGMTGNLAGPEGTIEAVTRLTGVPINYYIAFTFEAIEHLIDELGPIEFTIPDLYGDGVGMNYTDPGQDLYIRLPPGDYELNGEQVVWLLRYRKNNDPDTLKVTDSYLDGDRGRVEMQQQFLQAVVDQKLNAGLIAKIPAIFKVLSNEIDTNFTVSDVISYAGYLSGFTSDKIDAFSLPGESNDEDYGSSYWIADMAAVQQMVREKFGYPADNITVGPADEAPVWTFTPEHTNSDDESGEEESDDEA